MKNRQKYKLNKKFIQNRKIGRFCTQIKLGLRANDPILSLALRPGLLLFLVLEFSFILQNLHTNRVSATSLTLTIPSGISLNVTPDSNAKFSKSSVSTLSVKSDASFGYTLSIKSKNTDNSLTNGSSKITSISSAVSESDFSSKGANNTWGYLPSKLNSSDNSNFQPGPSTSDTILDQTSSPDASSDNNYNITLATKTDNTLVAGTYKNTFVLTASANTVSYSITYNLNSGTWSGTSPQSGNTTNSTITLDSNSPTKLDYTFKGWCDTSVTDNDTTSPSCSGTTHQPSGTYTLTGVTNNLILYAIWQQNVTYRSYTISYNNNFTSAGSPSNMPSAQTTPQAASTNNYQVNLSSNTPILSGYTFEGWCTSSSITNNGSYSPGPSCSDTKYNVSGFVTISSNNQTINLYAMWKKTTDDGEPCSRSGWSGTAKKYGGLCWMWTDYGNSNTFNFVEKCPSDWHLPSRDEFQKLLDAIGTGNQLYNAGWTSNWYWSSTKYSDRLAYSLLVGANIAYISHDLNILTNGASVRCVAS